MCSRRAVACEGIGIMLSLVHFYLFIDPTPVKYIFLITICNYSIFYHYRFFYEYNKIKKIWLAECIKHVGKVKHS